MRLQDGAAARVGSTRAAALATGSDPAAVCRLENRVVRVDGELNIEYKSKLQAYITTNRPVLFLEGVRPRGR